ncbi:MAG: hypothetical protein RL708_343 [Bacteroidota bacterium]|jgi:TRAP-type C4-dicarboxylate transport system permease small subunit
MKNLYNILTVLFWISVIYGAYHWIQMASITPIQNDGASTFGFVLGTTLAACVIPALILLIRYFVGKNNSEE